mmetsp:Transcript_51761/g.136862  ORF Transcript_51761/g.136862 Transcript_51761/m.136862 type:complete len:237 (-) Transcript_51761:4005-4715(-)
MQSTGQLPVWKCGGIGSADWSHTCGRNRAATTESRNPSGRKPGCHLSARLPGPKPAQPPARTRHRPSMVSTQQLPGAQTRRRTLPTSRPHSAGLQSLCSTGATPTTTSGAEGRWQNPSPASGTGRAGRTPTGCHSRPDRLTAKVVTPSTAAHPRTRLLRGEHPEPPRARRRSAPATAASDGQTSGSTPVHRPLHRATSWGTPARSSENWDASPTTRAGPRRALVTTQLAAAAASRP